jgi:hypothetical protein
MFLAMTQDISKLLADAKAREADAKKDREALEALKGLDTEALERVLRLIAAPPSVNPRPHSNGASPDLLVSSISAATRAAVNSLEGNFTAATVRDYITKTYPELKAKEKAGTISAVLSGLVKDQKIIKLTGNRGSASTFTKNHLVGGEKRAA